MQPMFDDLQISKSWRCSHFVNHKPKRADDGGELVPKNGSQFNILELFSQKPLKHNVASKCGDPTLPQKYIVKTSFLHFAKPKTDHTALLVQHVRWTGTFAAPWRTWLQASHHTLWLAILIAVFSAPLWFLRRSPFVKSGLTSRGWRSKSLRPTSSWYSFSPATCKVAQQRNTHLWEDLPGVQVSQQHLLGANQLLRAEGTADIPESLLLSLAAKLDILIQIHPLAQQAPQLPRPRDAHHLEK